MKKIIFLMLPFIFCIPQINAGEIGKINEIKASKVAIIILFLSKVILPKKIITKVKLKTKKLPHDTIGILNVMRIRIKKITFFKKLLNAGFIFKKLFIIFLILTNNHMIYLSLIDHHIQAPILDIFLF